MNLQRSEKLYREALNYLPGGVNSPVRAFRSVGMDPIFVDHAEGSRIYDVDGNEYIDFITSWGPLVLGHCPPESTELANITARRGISFGLPTAVEVEMARTIVNAYPGLEMVRMVNSGTEATMSAIRVARAYTNRNKVIKFEGCYHGHHDGMLVSCGSGALTFQTPTSPGVTQGVIEDTVVCRYNDLSAVRRAMEGHPEEIAAVIVEPVAANMGVVPPYPGFLEGLRDLTREFGALLIFDEVITGFRLAYGGAAEYYGVEPDIACFGKIIGAGMPVGAYGGKRGVMQMISPAGPVYQAGTLSGNPVAMTLGTATLHRLSQSPEIYEILEHLGARLESGIRANLHRLGLDYTVKRVGSLLSLFFTKIEIRSYDDVRRCDTERFTRYYRSMIQQGILCPPSQYEAVFISAAHSEADVDRMIEANRTALKEAVS